MILDERPTSFDRFVRMTLAAVLIWGRITAQGYLREVRIPYAGALLLANCRWLFLAQGEAYMTEAQGGA